MFDPHTATRDELMAYAKDVKGMTVSGKIGTEVLRSKLGGESNVEEVVSDEVVPPKKRTIIIQSTGDQLGDDVLIGINGRNTMIQRGEPVEVSEEIIHVLQNAKRTMYVTKTDKQTGEAALIDREVLAYPFQFVN